MESLIAPFVPYFVNDDLITYNTSNENNYTLHAMIEANKSSHIMGTYFQTKSSHNTKQKNPSQ